MKKIIAILFIACIGLSSCDSFLKEYSQDLVYANSVKDLSELLVGSGYAPTDNSTSTDMDFVAFHAMDDDVTYFPLYMSSVAPRSEFGFYYWMANPYQFANIAKSDPVWKWLYERLGTLNVIIVKVEEFKGEGIDYRKVKGEAHFLRAFYYFHLVNLYAKPYVKETASKDLGVPIKLTEYIEDKLYTRATVEEVYKLVVDDLLEAIRQLEGLSRRSVYRADEISARALLSRVYLYMNEWQLALNECTKVLQANYTLQDMNGFEGKSFTHGASPETIFSMGQNYVLGDGMDKQGLMIDVEKMSAMDYFTCSQDLLDCYEEGDLRSKLFFLYSPWGEPELPAACKVTTDEALKVSDRWLIRLSEIYLNKAEAQAMLNDETGAIATLKQLRTKRFENNEAPDVTGGGQSLLKEIWKERRRELCFEGHRWFDLRRYAVNTKYPTPMRISHAYYMPNYSPYPDLVGESVLEEYPNEHSWVLPIPDYAIIFNEGKLVQNEPRKERNYTIE